MLAVWKFCSCTMNRADSMLTQVGDLASRSTAAPGWRICRPGMFGWHERPVVRCVCQVLPGSAAVTCLPI